jgi:hypothetical protein
MDINEKIRLIADGEFEVVAKLSVDEITGICRLVRGLRNSLDWVTQERDDWKAQLKAMQAEREQLLAQVESIGDKLANAEIAIQSFTEQKPAYKIDYQYADDEEDPDLEYAGDLVFYALDGKDYARGTLFYAQAVPAQQVQSELRYCNDCEWTGTTDRMCGAIGPLCPECGETTGVEPFPAVAVPDYDAMDAMIDELRGHLEQPPHLSGKEFIKGCLHALDTLKCRTKTKRDWLLRTQAAAVPVGEIDFRLELGCIKLLLQQSGNLAEANTVVQTLDYIIALRRECDALKIIANCTDTSPRITEQDAREIATAIFKFVGLPKNTETNFSDWFNGYGGSALLNKLNDKPESVGG